VNHRDLDLRSLEFGRRIAAKLRADPTLVQIARENVRRWQDRPEAGASLLQCYEEWSQLLTRLPAEELADLLERDDEDAARLRQNSPFAGVLAPREVWEIKQEFAHATHRP
jgi:hypothetical protein